MSTLVQHTTLLLSIILLISFTLRVVALGNTPQGLHADEASFLLNAQSMLQTGKDEDGRVFPFSLHSFIDPKPALYSYLQIPFVAVLGTTVTAARLPAVIAGVISVWLFYLILNQLGVQKHISLLATFLMAISPWHIMVSRATQEVILSFACALAAVFFMLKYIDLKWQKLLLPLALFSFLSMYFYHSNKVFLMGLFAAWVGLFIWQKKTTLKKSIVTIVVLSAMFLLSLMLQDSSTRFSAVGILSNQGPQLILDDQIRKATGHSSPLVIRVFYNKATFYGREFVNQYLSHYSPDFLFFKGGEPKRYLIPYQGLFYLVEIPLLILGIFSIIRQNKKFSLLMISWLVLAPLPAALTFTETPSVIRAFLLIVPLLYFVAEGLVWLVQQPRAVGKVGIAVVFAGYLWCGAYFWQQLSIQQKVSTPWYRNSPYSQLAIKIKEVEQNYDKIVVVNDLRPLYSYFALAGLISIEELQQHPLARNQDQYQIGKYEFSRRQCDLGEPNERILYIAETTCQFEPEKEYNIIIHDSATYDDGVKVYSLIAFVKKPSLEQ